MKHIIYINITDIHVRHKDNVHRKSVNDLDGSSLKGEEDDSKSKQCVNVKHIV